MSIVAAIDTEKASIEEEIGDLEERLTETRLRLERYDKLRGLAQELESEDGEPAVLDDVPADDPPAPEPQKSEGGGIGEEAPDDDPAPAEPELGGDAVKVLNFVEDHGKDGLASGEICTGTRVPGERVRKALLELRGIGAIEMRGIRAGARYFPKGSAKP